MSIEIDWEKMEWSFFHFKIEVLKLIASELHQIARYSEAALLDTKQIIFIVPNSTNL